MNLQMDKRIKQLRQKAGVTQIQAAKALSMNRSTYCRRESLGNFSPDQLMQLAQLFKISMDAFWQDDPGTPPSRHVVPDFYHAGLPPQQNESAEPTRLNDVVVGWNSTPFSPEITNTERYFLHKYRLLNSDQRLELDIILDRYIEEINELKNN